MVCDQLPANSVHQLHPAHGRHAAGSHGAASHGASAKHAIGAQPEARLCSEPSCRLSKAAERMCASARGGGSEPFFTRGRLAHPMAAPLGMPGALPLFRV